MLELLSTMTKARDIAFVDKVTTILLLLTFSLSSPPSLSLFRDIKSNGKERKLGVTILTTANQGKKIPQTVWKT